MATLKDILKDSQSFGDALVITLQNGASYTLGDLRTLSAEDQRSLSAREETLKKKQDELAAKVAELQNAQKTTAELFRDVSAREEALKSRAGTNSNGDNSDPWQALAALESDNILGPMVKLTKSQMANVQAKLDEQAKNYAAVLDGIKKLSETYLGDKLFDTYEALVPEAKRGDITLEKLVQDAMAKQYKTRTGYVDIRKSYLDMTASERAAEERAKLETEIRAKVMDELSSKGLHVASPAGGGGMTMSDILPGANREPSKFKSIDEALNAAAKDTDIWRGFSSGMAIQ